MRDLIEAQLANPETAAEGRRALKDLLLSTPSLKNYQFAHRIIVASGFAHSRQVRIALLTSYTADFVVPLLKAELMLSDIGATLFTPHFNQFRQEVLNPSSRLYEFAPDVAIIGFNLEDIFPDPVARFPTLTAGDRDALRRDVLELYRSLAENFRRHAPQRAQLLLQNLVSPPDSFDPLVRGPNAIQAFVDSINTALEASPSILDYSRLVRECGARTWTDPRTYYTARIPVAQHRWIDLARCYAAYVRAGLSCEVKCIVLDLDNTLWGGVLGEDGFDGIRLGDTYPGVVFRRFQECLLALHANGYILAISSKNDSSDVLDVLRRHPGMVLREQHFGAIAANWSPKADNIRDISRQIQISVDHMLFVDDNPVEIAKVRGQVPGIACLQLESPPLNFLRQFDEARCFNKLLVTDEDRHRGQQYFEERQRRVFKQSVTSLDEFYRSLAQRLTIFVNHGPHTARIAQLTQRTNQFNMTTLRLTEPEVAQMMSHADYMLVTADLSDQFGDSGTIAFVQIRSLPGQWDIENWLMSCRVLGRTVEERLVDELCVRARSAGAVTMTASYVPSRKNAPFAEFYLQNGFIEIEKTESGRRRFSLDVAAWTSREAFVEIVQGSGQAV